MLQWVLSVVPWWLYAAGAVAAYIAIRRYFGEKPALTYAILAVWWVSYDKGGDDRAAYERAQGKVAVDRADTSHSTAAGALAADLQSKLDDQSRKLKEATDALETLAGAPGCSADDVLDRLPGWRSRP